MNKDLNDHKKPEDAEVAKAVRAKRDRLLAETDWTQVKDIFDTVSFRWVLYRQELRDIPQQEGFPHNIKWPTKPE